MISGRGAESYNPAMLSALFVDMNSYFASCEQQERPELRGKPIAVAPVASDYTCCIAASYEAKAFGVKTGTPIWQARKLCQGLTIVLARPEVYIRFHHQILAAIDTCIPVKAVLSVDECVCELMGTEREPAQAEKIAYAVKAAIFQRVGTALRCSIGIAPNGYIAKVAADMKKPDGLTLIQQHELPDILYQLKLDDFVGIGPRMLKRLNAKGIQTVEHLYALSELQMRAAWDGVVGARLYRLIRGEDVPGPITRRRTVGHSHVLAPQLRTADGARAVMIRLIHKAAARMRSMRLWTSRVELTVEILQRPRWFARRDILLSQDTRSILEAVDSVWVPPEGVPIRVGVVLACCQHDSYVPAPLFEAERKRLELSRVMDRINLRYGLHAVYYGGMHDTKHAAPLRISFNSIPDPSMPW